MAFCDLAVYSNLTVCIPWTGVILIEKESKVDHHSSWSAFRQNADVVTSKAGATWSMSSMLSDPVSQPHCPYTWSRFCCLCPKCAFLLADIHLTFRLYISKFSPNPTCLLLHQTWASSRGSSGLYVTGAYHCARPFHELNKSGIWKIIGPLVCKCVFTHNVCVGGG